MRRPRKTLPLKPFHEVLRFVMEMRGYANAVDLAEDTGISGATLSRYLSGERPRPYAAEIIELARVLRFDAADLLGASAKMVREPSPDAEAAPPGAPTRPFGKLKKKAGEPAPAAPERALPPRPTPVDE